MNIKKFEDFNKNINEEVDIRDVVRKKVNPTVDEIISKLTSLMMSASYHGLRAKIGNNKKEQYDDLIKFIFDSKKLHKKIKKFETTIEKLKSDRKITFDEYNDGLDFIRRAIEEIRYRFPYDFEYDIRELEKNDLEEIRKKYNELAKKYNTKLL